MIKRKNIPTILAILLLTTALAVGIFLVQKGQIFFLRATPENTPTQIKVTNITNSSITISWITEKGISGSLVYGETASLGQTAIDDRDKISGSTGSFKTHYLTVNNLKPKITYFYKINSGPAVYDNSGKPYEVTTASSPQQDLPGSDLASGIILKADRSPAEGSIIYLTLPNTTPQSTLVRASGNWVLPLNTAFSTSLDSFASYDKEAQVEEIFVQGETTAETATAITTTKNDNPVGEITLGKNYDFREELPEISQEEEALSDNLTPTPATASSKFSLSQITPTGEVANNSLRIISPNQNESITTLRPEIIGKGPVGKTIKIVIESPATYTDQVTTDDQGNWNFSPPTDLAPGTHTVKVTLNNQTVSRTFIVLAAGESSLPAFTATPSGQINQKGTPTPTPTSSARTAMPATESATPSPGEFEPTFLILISGFVLILGGFLMTKIFAHA